MKKWIKCKVIVMGIRRPRTTPELPRPQFDGSDNDIQWVEISGCQYSITDGELLCWLHLYGESLSKVRRWLTLIRIIRILLETGSTLSKWSSGSRSLSYCQFMAKRWDSTTMVYKDSAKTVMVIMPNKIAEIKRLNGLIRLRNSWIGIQK